MNYTNNIELFMFNNSYSHNSNSEYSFSSPLHLTHTTVTQTPPNTRATKTISHVHQGTKLF